MPKRIPIAAAKRIADEFECSQVIVLAFDAQGATHVVTYGRTRKDCEQAAEGGNNMKRVMGWPESLCNAKPARARSAPEMAVETVTMECGCKYRNDGLPQHSLLCVFNPDHRL